jgi:F-type H+-transporting ATPase subunit gamma
MATLRDIKRRIGSVKNTRQITKAMKMVAAAKLRRAQTAILAMRPYAQKFRDVMRSFALRTREKAHPIFNKVENIKRRALIVVASDRGLCGGYNTNIIKATMAFLAAVPAGQEVQVVAIGRRVRDSLKHRGVELRAAHTDLLQTVERDDAEKIVGELEEDFVKGRLAGLDAIYTEFKGAMSSTVETEQVLPLKPIELEAGSRPASEYIYEPDAETLLDALLSQHFKLQLFRIFLEANAAEHASRMAAMESATKNASEMIESLTLQYNRARQAKITTELIEIVAGAEAL